MCVHRHMRDTLNSEKCLYWDDLRGEEGEPGSKHEPDQKGSEPSAKEFELDLVDDRTPVVFCSLASLIVPCSHTPDTWMMLRNGD